MLLFYTRLRKGFLGKRCLVAWLPLFFFMLAACNSTQKTEFVKAHLDKVVSTLSDSSFFGYCMDVVYFDNHLLIMDAKNNRLVTCDTAFHILANIGKAGKGPEEILEPLRSCIKDNRIYCFDGGNLALSVFSMDGKFLKKITYPRRFIPSTRFAMDDSSKIFIGLNELDSPIVVLDTVGHIVKQFGAFSLGKSIEEQRSRSEKHIFLFNNQLLCVGRSEPLIEIYTKEGKKVKEFNLAQDPYMVKSADFAESLRQKNPQGTPLLLNDAYLVNNHLYLLLTTANAASTSWTPDKILVYTIGATLEFYQAFDLSLDLSEEEQIKQNKVLWYETFAVSPDEKRIFAFAANRSEWRVFSLPDRLK